VQPLFLWCAQNGELAAAKALCRIELCQAAASMEAQLAELLEVREGEQQLGR